MSTARYMLMGHRAMCADDLQGGTVLLAGATIAATVGVFALRQDLMTGGFSPSLEADVEIADCDIHAAIKEGRMPANFALHSGQNLTVMLGTGRLIECRLGMFTQAGPLWLLHVIDKNQGA